MSSPFFGLNIGVTALLASQHMLDTAAHNVANANTPGYSRQRVTLHPAPPYTYPAFNRSGLPGQIGAGVSVAMISRVRDAFLDLQIQSQTALLGQWQTRQDELSKVESLFPEPGSSALGSTISKLWDAWHDVASDPTSTAARAALVEQSGTLAAELNRDASQLKSLASGIDYQVGQTITTINDLASQIADLNGQIQRVTVSGDHPNDLLDQRDRILAELSNLVPTTVVANGDGTIAVLVGGTDLVSNVTARTVGAAVGAGGHTNPVWPDGSPLTLRSGKLASLLEIRDSDLAGYQAQLDELATGLADAVNAIHARGVDMTGAAGLPFFTYTPGDTAATLRVNGAIAADPRRIAAAATANAPGDSSIAGLIADLRNASSYPAGVPGTDVVGGDQLTTNGTATLRFVSAGRATAGTYTFTGSGASLTLSGPGGSQTIVVGPLGLGATQTLEFDKLGIRLTLATDSTNSKAAADIVADLTTAGHDTLQIRSLFNPPQTTADFYAGIVGKIGADAGQAAEMTANQQLVVDHLEMRQEQTSGVSLDEEATDMIRFQHAYQAASRVITTMDEMLDVLINRTGLVGR